MLCLGIESTAHTFSAGIVDSQGEVLANEKNAVVTEEGGIKPGEAADSHIENAVPVIERALKKSEKKISEIDLISFAQGPGLGPCLRVGATTARGLSLLHNKPLLGVNHCIAHIEIGRKKTGAKDPLVVYASGANTQVIAYKGGKYRVFGETLDTWIGNLLDTFGRELGLGFPAGPVLDRMYFEGSEAGGCMELIELPYSVKGMDLNFSGLLTAAKRKVGKVRKEDLAYSLLHTAFAMLTEVSERAMVHAGKKELLLTGGVGASRALQEMLREMCKGQGAKFHVTPRELSVDNGAMIAWQGLVEYKAGRRQKLSETRVNQRFRTDDVSVNWR
ncbi:bifunctional N(6)-L-threonylcarbamoyladenine synthase/serine/threonine protein kinase [Candidatus Micrarchaeota archaeon]|nr:bifunctional N(6)-L-threonylcarbamoyladenine synthase/serine/threonine protein kinase [Candidatus Micrarchaeota archaeon]